MKFVAPVLALAVTACAATTAGEPSLARRPAEAIDPRLPVTNPIATDPADPALVQRVGELVGQARAAASAFNEAEPRVRALAAAAGPAQGESWITAQLALSDLQRLRGPAVAAAADLDAMRSVQAQSGTLPLASDLALVEQAAAELRDINAALSERYDAIAASLAR